MKLKTREQIRTEFAYRGLSVTKWAIDNNLNPSLVSAILNDSDQNPVRKCLRGDSHKIAVILGLKEGQINCERLVA